MRFRGLSSGPVNLTHHDDVAMHATTPTSLLTKGCNACSYVNAQYYEERGRCPRRGDNLSALNGHASNSNIIVPFYSVHLACQRMRSAMRVTDCLQHSNTLEYGCRKTQYPRYRCTLPSAECVRYITIKMHSTIRERNSTH